MTYTATEINTNLVTRLLEEVTRKVIAVPQIYTKITGSISNALLLAQIKYWYERCGTFYKSDPEFADELGIGINQFKSAKKKLIELEIIEVEVKGVPPKSYYTLNEDKITELMLSYLHDNNMIDENSYPIENIKSAENQPINRMVNSQAIENIKEVDNQPISWNSTDQSAENQPINPYITYINKKEKKYTKKENEKTDWDGSDDPVQSKSDINAIEDQSCVNKTEKLSTYRVAAKSSSNQVTDSKAKERFNIISIPQQSTKHTQFKEGTELSEDWKTIALNEGVHESWIESIYREFVEYWTGTTGKKAFKKDWKATWRNWVSREAIRKKYPKPASQIAEQEQAVTREFKELEEETQEAIIRRKLREKVGDASYHSWIQGLGFEIAGDTIKVYAKTAFIRDWVQREYSKLIKECSNFTKVSLLIGQIEKPEEQKHSDQQRKIALIEARIDSIEHDPTLRKIRKYLLNRMGDGYERLLGHVKLYYETGYLKAYVTNVAHRSFLLNYHDTILKALDGKVKKFEVSIVESVSV